MSQNGKRGRSRYAVMVVREQDDGAVSNHYISGVAVEIGFVVLFILLTVFICKTIYDSFVIRDLKSQLMDQMVKVNDLTDENESLFLENETLNAKVAVLSETVTTKAANEDAMSAEEIENALPKGFPLSGTATMEENATEETENDNPILKFKASSGVNVISSGTGTVLSIEDDADYGNRIIIDHGNGYRSIYRNGGEVLVKEGESLGKGYILFSIGKNNQELGYQITYNDEYIDPMTIINIDG